MNENLKVAIVGAGPAGLSAAKDLLTAGVKVDIYDRENFAGGVMAFGIPGFRIGQETVNRSITPVQDLGGNFIFGKDLKESDFLDLAIKYDYVYLAFGLTKVRRLGVPGEDLEGSLDALDFLRDFNFEDKLNLKKSKPTLHGTVILVGAGNVAMDGARAAVRCGAEKTIIVYRRSRDEAPCKKNEMEDAENEGVELQFLTNPVELIGENGHVTKCKCEVMELGEPDASGRRSPVGTGKYIEIPCDYVISAIGQIPDSSVWNVGKIETNHGYVVGKEKYGAGKMIAYQTNVENIFTGGDVVLGAKTIGDALLCGKGFAKYVLEHK